MGKLTLGKKRQALWLLRDAGDSYPVANKLNVDYNDLVDFRYGTKVTFQELTDQITEQANSLCKNGETNSHISEQLGISLSEVNSILTPDNKTIRKNLSRKLLRRPKLTKEEREKIIDLRIQKYTLEEISRITGISSVTVCNVVNGKNRNEYMRKWRDDRRKKL